MIDGKTALAQINHAEAMIAAATTIPEVQHLIAMATAAVAYAKASHSELIADALELQALSERRLGQLLDAAPKAKGGGDQVSDHRSLSSTGGHDSPPTLAEQGVSKDLSARAQRFAGVPDEAFKKHIDDAKETGGFTLSKLHKQIASDTNHQKRIQTNDDTTENAKPHVSKNSGEDNWHTPKRFIDAAREVMGRIDLDPASCVEANAIVKAEMFYTQGDDGLSQPWNGKVWLNPPYGKRMVGPFCKTLIDHMTDGTTDEAIVLVNNATETTWGQALLSRGDAVCFPEKRIQFCGPNDSGGTPLQGQMIVYLGPSGGSFIKVFSQFGVVVS